MVNLPAIDAVTLAEIRKFDPSPAAVFAYYSRIVSRHNSRLLPDKDDFSIRVSIHL